MKAFNFLNGTWTGTIVYGEKYMEFANKQLFFDLELHNENEIIRGTAIDIGGEGMSFDEASIYGKFNGKEINFVKQYSTLHYYENGEMKYDASQKGSLIYYSGHYNEQVQSFSGRWEFRIKYKKFWFIPMTYRAGGTWTMHKK